MKTIFNYGMKNEDINPKLIKDKLMGEEIENINFNEWERKVEIQKAVEREKRRLEGLTELIKRHDKVRGLSLRDKQYIISAEQYCNDHRTSYSPFLIPKVIANKLKRIIIRQLCKQYRNIWKGSVFIYFLRIGTYPTLSIKFDVYQSMGSFSSWSVRAEYEVNINSDQIKLVSASPIP